MYDIGKKRLLYKILNEILQLYKKLIINLIHKINKNLINLLIQKLIKKLLTSNLIKKQFILLLFKESKNL